MKWAKHTYCIRQINYGKPREYSKSETFAFCHTDSKHAHFAGMAAQSSGRQFAAASLNVYI